MGARYAKKTNKKQLHVMISSETYELLKRLAPQLYGGPYRGAISYVVEQALRAYLYPRLHTHKNTNPESRVRLIYNSVKDCIAREYGGFTPEQVPYRQLEMCIGEVRGGDPRTIKKWLGIFEKRGLIKWLTPKSNPPERTVIELL